MNARTLTRIRFGLNGLFLAAFLLRSLIPAGYMLDLAAAGTSMMTVTLCGGATITVPVDGTGNKPDTQTAHHHEAPCPFSVNTIFSFDSISPPAHAPLFALLFVLAALTALALAPQRRFGNASSRSPPVFSSR